MSQVFNIYCDESCHLENDHQPVMVLGAVWCPLDKTREIADRMREIRSAHGLSPLLELKWGKVSPAQLPFYMDMLNYFFDEPDLHFRALVVPDKSRLRHEDFDQDHDTWYYKMYFLMLRALMDAENQYRVYIDIKDTRGGRKVRLLQDILRSSIGDRVGEVVERVQQVVSKEVQQVQLADFLTGIISYANRRLDTSTAKNVLVKQMELRAEKLLIATTAQTEPKVNLFRWRPQEHENV